MKKLVFSKKINYYLITFMSVSILGYVCEFYYSMIFRNKVINPGFLIGPCCPIYGYGALIMIFLLSKYRENRKKVFLLSAISFTTFEYFTSFILEKLFDMKLWDYSWFFLNINGRVCFIQAILWGIVGIVFIRKVEPLMYKLYLKIKGRILNIIFTIIYVVYIIDSVYQIVTLLK